MEKKNIRAIMRGHFISVDMKPKRLEKYGDELYKTKNFCVIIGKKQVSFKQNKRVFRFKYDEVKQFYLKNSNTFVFVLHNVKKKFYFVVA